MEDAVVPRVDDLRTKASLCLVSRSWRLAVCDGYDEEEPGAPLESTAYAMVYQECPDLVAWFEHESGQTFYHAVTGTDVRMPVLVDMLQDRREDRFAAGRWSSSGGCLFRSGWPNRPRVALTLLLLRLVHRCGCRSGRQRLDALAAYLGYAARAVACRIIPKVPPPVGI
jgi:hypothetical protein